MTVLCVASYPQEGIAPCLVAGVHYAECEDTETCPGCVFREAERGFFCQGHFERAGEAYRRWVEFLRDAEALGGAAAKSGPEIRVQSSGGGHINIPRLKVDVDEVERLLAGIYQHSSFELWVHTEQGALDALMFARAAGRVMRTHPLREFPSRVRRVPCPHCEEFTLLREPPHYEGQSLLFRCQNSVCERVIDQDAMDVIERITRDRRA